MTTVEQLAVLDRLRARPFPERPGWSDGIWSGPGCHIADLRLSEDFWEDDGTRRREVMEQFEAECQALVMLLTRRWGAPEVLDLTGHLERSMEGEPVAEPLLSLCGYVVEIHAWRIDGRWIGIGVGQQDKELPFQLVVAVGEGDVGSVPG
ncbi:hypothetical protein [Streptomyces sp. 8N706]|uniref:hypothetical protein n=1 Tax=Streptomyces sp. 8N706 TaxID=3457416 RepID=UPI003FD20B39